jgi:hypothetical protein
MTEDAKPTLEEALNEIKTKPVVDAPVVCAALEISRGTYYAAVERGQIEVMEVGRLKKAITAPLRRKLGIEA